MQYARVFPQLHKANNTFHYVYEAKVPLYKYPCTFYRFGVRGASNADTGGLHSANFCIDEEALSTGFGGMAWLAWKFIT